MKTCGARETFRDIELKRREAVDSVLAMSKPARAKVLLAAREMVKESVVADPDMSDQQKKTAKDFVDYAWKNVVILSEFKTEAGVKSGRAYMDYEENKALGRMPILCGLAWIRAHVLYIWRPFDKSIHGKVKHPMYLVLLLISMVPFWGVRLAFFTLMLLLHVSGIPPDTYQMVMYILEMKGTQFKSGGVVLFFYGMVEYAMCENPGDLKACHEIGPGFNIRVELSVLDLVGSCLLSWIGFVCILWSHPHDGEERGRSAHATENIDDLMLRTGFSEKPDKAEIIHDCFPSFCRWPCCIAVISCGQSCLSFWPHGARRVFFLLLYDLGSFIVTLCFLMWLIRFDIATAQVEHGVDIEDVTYDLDDLTVWWETPQARISLFKARVVYNVLAMPFIILVAPGLSMLISLQRRTGYNPNGWCVPFTLRPTAKNRCRACDQPGSSRTLQPGYAQVPLVAQSGPYGSHGINQDSRFCTRQCGMF